VSPNKVATWKLDRVEVLNTSTSVNSVFPGGITITDANTLIPLTRELQLVDFKARPIRIDHYWFWPSIMPQFSDYSDCSTSF
jgi:hypothetical protein